MIAVLVCIFAISVSAAGSTSDAYGTITTVDGETEPNENEKYCFVSYNDIVNAPSTDEEVTQ